MLGGNVYPRDGVLRPASSCLLSCLHGAHFSKSLRCLLCLLRLALVLAMLAVDQVVAWYNTTCICVCVTCQVITSHSTFLQTPFRMSLLVHSRAGWF